MKFPIAFAAVLALAACSKESSDKKNVEQAQLEVASCKVLHMGGVSPLDNNSTADQTTPVVACFESKSQLTVDWCEKMATNFDLKKHYYELFKGQASCPTEGLAGKCVYKATDRNEAVTIWYYENSELKTDFELVRKGCNYSGMYFSLQ